MHFGTKADEIEFELPHMEKLSNRMNKINEKKSKLQGKSRRSMSQSPDSTPTRKGSQLSQDRKWE